VGARRAWAAGGKKPSPRRRVDGAGRRHWVPRKRLEGAWSGFWSLLDGGENWEMLKAVARLEVSIKVYVRPRSSIFCDLSCKMNKNQTTF
jgi:hypothetical protein